MRPKKSKAAKTKGESIRPRPATSRGVLGLHVKFLVISGEDMMKISRSVDGSVEDLSLTGLVLQTGSMRIDDLHLSYDDSPARRNKLTMEIDLPQGRKVTAIGEVSWYERSIPLRDQIYHVGITFKEISAQDRDALKQYLVTVKKAAKTIVLDV